MSKQSEICRQLCVLEYSRRFVSVPCQRFISSRQVTFPVLYSVLGHRGAAVGQGGPSRQSGGARHPPAPHTQLRSLVGLRLSGCAKSSGPWRSLASCQQCSAGSLCPRNFLRPRPASEKILFSPFLFQRSPNRTIGGCMYVRVYIFYMLYNMYKI